MSFGPTDLELLGQLLAKAHAVIGLQEVHAGNARRDVIALRHDIDDNAHSFDTATKIAQWEARNGYRSTFYVLHTASYWTDEPFLRLGLEQIAVCGHEIGIHANAIAHALVTGADPHETLWGAIDQLRDWGFQVRGVAPHGDEVCYRAGPILPDNGVAFVNDEQFIECARPELGAPDRTLAYKGHQLRLEPMPLAAFGLVYDAYRLPKGRYLSDTGGNWNHNIEEVTSDLGIDGQLHVLQHPDWWRRAFMPQAVAA